MAEAGEPFEATGFRSEPGLPNPYQNGDLKGHNGTFSSLTAGTPWTISIDYSRAIDTLSVAGQNVQAGGAAETNSVQQFVQQNLVLILVGVAVVLIVVGVVWFWVSGQESSGNGKKRKRRISKSTEVSDDVVYCHECGKRATPGDKFCRACGVKLRKEA